MILDNEKQRSLLLQLINSVQFNGSALDEAYNLKQAIVTAEIKDQKTTS